MKIITIIILFGAITVSADRAEDEVRKQLDSLLHKRKMNAMFFVGKRSIDELSTESEIDQSVPPYSTQEIEPRYNEHKPLVFVWKNGRYRRFRQERPKRFNYVMA